MLYGNLDVERYLTREEITQRLMEQVAFVADKKGHSWDVFNVKIAFKAVV